MAVIVIVGVIVIAAGVASFLVRIFAWATILNGNGLVNRVLSALGAARSRVLIVDRAAGRVFGAEQHRQEAA